MSNAAAITASQKLQPTEQWANLPASTYAVPSVIPTSTGTLALTTNVGIATPFYLDRKIGITAVGALITSAGTAASVVRIGLYTWNPVTRALGTLVKDFGTVAADATSIQTATASQTVEPGWYAWVICTTAASPATLRSFLAAMAAVAGSFTISTTTALNVTHYTFTATSLAANGYAVTGPAVTAVTSASVFDQSYFVLARFNAANPAP